MRYFTSDLHFGHRNIIKYCDRPWQTQIGVDFETGEAIFEPDVDAMNEGLVERFNSLVGPRDETWILGDFALSFPIMQEWVPKLNGDLILVAGNHDHCWDGQKKRKPVESYTDAGFAAVFTSGIVPNFELENGRRVTLSHLPYEGDHGEADRYQSHRPHYRGQINVCGHVHEKWITQHSPRGASLNVGVDVWAWYPVPEEIVIEEVGHLID